MAGLPKVIPYEVVLVVLGTLLGFLPFRATLALKPELVLFLFIPPLLLEGVWHIDSRLLVARWQPTALLAVAGTFATAVLAATSVELLWGTDWATALLFGAIVCATDPIGVLSVFRRVGAPPALGAIIEGESLVNDGVAVVLFGIGGALLHPLSAAERFAAVTLVGVLCGAVVGAIAVALLRFLRWQWLEVALTLAMAYGSYALADRLHASGIFAVLAAGLFLNARERRASAHRVVAIFWDRFAFIANVALWIIVGLQIDLALVVREAAPVVAAIAATYLARAIAVFLLLRLLPKRQRIPRSWRVVLVWGGLRGAIAMALALSLPAHVAHRDLLVAATAGVVLVTIVLGGTTMQPLLVRLGMTQSGS